MYYKLKTKYLLRGWKQLPTGVVDTELGYTSFLSKDKYAALRLCNGVLDSEMLFITPEMREAMAELEEAGYVDGFGEQQDATEDIQDYFEYDNRLIRSIHWSITGKCNYNCRHCFMSAPDHKHPEMSFEDCKKVIEDLHNCGVFGVQLTGGEALTHPHFWDIVELLRTYNITISAIYSNGFLIDEKFFENCEKYKIKPCVSLSFDGTGGWHEWLRGIPQSMEHITRALDLCKEHGFRTVVEFCIHDGNKDELAESMRYLQLHGCSSVKINPLADMGRGAEIKDKMLSMPQLYDICKEYIPQYKKDNLTMDLYLGNVLLRGDQYLLTNDHHLKEETIENHVVCGHARNELCISPDGNATPCATMMDTPIGRKMPSIVEMGMKNVLNDSTYMQAITFTLGEYLKKNPDCVKCPHLCKCAGGCRAVATDEDGNSSWSGIDHTTCEFYLSGQPESMANACIESGFRHL